MVIKISESKNMAGKFNYNNNKLEKLEVIRSYSNLLSDDPLEAKNILYDVAAQNSRVKTKYITGILSFSQEEMQKTTAQQRSSLLQELLAGAKIDNTPVISWEHRDTDNIHIHFIASKVDFDGNKINDSFLKLKFSDVAEKMERKYDLSKDHSQEKRIENKKSKIKNKDSNLNEINYEKYKMHRALKTMNSKNYNFSFFSEDEKLREILINKKDISREEIEKKLDKNLFLALENASKKWQKSSFKQDLQAQLNEIRKASKNIEEYKNNLTEKGIYHYVFFEKEKQIIKYGFKEHGIYFGEDRINEKYKISELNKYFKYKPYLNTAERIIEKAKDQAENKEEFAKILLASGIKMGEKTFFVGDVKMNYSDLNFSTTKLDDLFKEKTLKSEIKQHAAEFKDFGRGKFKAHFEERGFKVNFAFDEQNRIADLVFKKADLIFKGSELGIDPNIVQAFGSSYFQDLLEFLPETANQYQQRQAFDNEEEEEKKRKKKKKDKDFGI